MMSTSVLPSQESKCFSSPPSRYSAQDDGVDRVDAANEGHSVDAPDVGQQELPKATANDEDSSARQESPVFSVESFTVDKPAKETDDEMNVESRFTSSGAEGEKPETRSPKQSNIEKHTKNAALDIDLEISRSKSIFLSPEVSAIDGEVNPNVYWLNTEFARLIGDKKKSMKTTREMREELKKIGLGDLDLSSSKPKSVEDMMREYGLEPTVSATSSCSQMASFSSPWTTKYRYGITNMSQNNETLLTSKSEIDEVKTNGSSVDGDFLREPSSNTSFVHSSVSRDKANFMSDVKQSSRTPSFSYADFKNSSSPNSLDQRHPSRTGLDYKRMDERSLNPNLFFQRERERLQRIDSVISRTPRSSFTNMASSINAWDTTDNTLGEHRRTMPSQRSSYLNMELETRYGNYDKDETEWGKISLSRPYLQRSSSILPSSMMPSSIMSSSVLPSSLITPSTFTPSSRQYSPLTNASHYPSHDNPIYRDSSSLSSAYSKKPYSRSSPTGGKEHTALASKSTRTQSIPAKASSRQPPPMASEKSANKAVSKLPMDSHRGSKTPKTKPRQSKSSASNASNSSSRARTLADVDREDFLARLMKNYSNSCLNARNEQDLSLKDPTNRDFADVWGEFSDPVGGHPGKFVHTPTNSRSDIAMGQCDDVNGKSGKYKPYQPHVQSRDNDLARNEASHVKATLPNAPMAWTGSTDWKTYLMEDNDGSSSFRSDAECFHENGPSEMSLLSNSGDLESSDGLYNFGNTGTPSYVSSQGKASCRGAKGCKSAFNKSYDLDGSAPCDGEGSCTPTPGKTLHDAHHKVKSMRSKSVPKRKTTKRK